jgi:DNA polymerase III epsilon subunit-like protein
MHINGITDSAYNLSGAAERTLGECFHFTEHRAYEDALATAAIFVAIRQVDDVA